MRKKCVAGAWAASRWRKAQQKRFAQWLERKWNEYNVDEDMELGDKLKEKVELMLLEKGLIFQRNRDLEI